jgi:hypothetical protein
LRGHNPVKARFVLQSEPLNIGGASLRQFGMVFVFPAAGRLFKRFQLLTPPNLPLQNLDDEIASTLRACEPVNSGSYRGWKDAQYSEDKIALMGYGMSLKTVPAPCAPPAEVVPDSTPERRVNPPAGHLPSAAEKLWRTVFIHSPPTAVGGVSW